MNKLFLQNLKSSRELAKKFFNVLKASKISNKFASLVGKTTRRITAKWHTARKWVTRK